MIDFKSVTLADSELLASYIVQGERRDANLSMANLFCWQFLNCSSFALIEEQLVFRFCFPDNMTAYSILSNNTDVLPEIIRHLAKQAMDENLPLYLYGIFPEITEMLDRIYPDVFEYRSDRDYFDYLYISKDLAELKGGELKAKRNHVNKFRKSYKYRYTPMSKESIPACLMMYDEWCKERHCENDEGLEYEQHALYCALNNFEELNLTGGVLYVDEEIIGFTYGAPVNYDTFCVHAEKAFASFDGAYNIINYEFANYLKDKYTYLNREEDMGIEGLRKAKLSYRPVKLLEKGIAICAEGLWDKLL